MVEVILQLLICIIDAELLKAVGLKVLKAKNVQNANGQALEKQYNEWSSFSCTYKLLLSYLKNIPM